MNVTKSLTALRFCSKDKRTLLTIVTCQLQLTMNRYSFFRFSFIVAEEIPRQIQRDLFAKFVFGYLTTIFLNTALYFKHR